MYKILLADNEGIVLDSLIHIINERYGEACDIRVATTVRYARTLARKFIPDIALVNIQMPGMHGFEIVREIRSYHLKCVFITVSSYGRSAFLEEAKNLNILAHLTKPLFREKVLPALEEAVSIVSLSQKRLQQNEHIQEKFDAVMPMLEHGFISQLFFPGDPAVLEQYKNLLDIPQTRGRLVTLTFGEGESAQQNLIGSSVRLQKEYMRFREIVHEQFPLAVIGPIMGNHVLFFLPSWKEESKQEHTEFVYTLRLLTEALENAFEALTFYEEFGPVQLLEDLRL